jgi:type IV pilus assembly protein PilC
MPFHYVAIAPTGEQVRGKIDVTSEAQAERALWDASYRVISIRKDRELPKLEKILPSLYGVKKRALITFSRQLATLLQSGVPVMRSLELLEEQATAKPLAAAIRGVSHEIRGGSSFADALRGFPAVFPALYPRMVELGERTGRLEEMLNQLADYMEREEQVMKRVRSAFAYPAFIVLLAIGVAGLLMTTALPALTGLFEEFGGDLPITTRLLIGASDFASAYRIQIFGAVLLAALGVTLVAGQPLGRRILDRFQITMPVLKDITLNANAARFSRTLSLMLRAGLPLTEVMEMLVKTTDNGILRRKVDQVRQQLIDGDGLSGPMARAGCFPAMLVQMVAVGEETGTLDANLDITADFYAREVDQKVDALAGMLSPALTIVVGIIVGFVALSLVMPMYQLIGDINEATSANPPGGGTAP